ncbi:MAG: hypothetical protein QOJ40_2806 [Verrucomicrobiota bacterium]
MISSTKAESESRLTTGAGQEGFDWPLANEAEEFLRERAKVFLETNGFAQRLARRMRDETGTDFFEWIDHLVLSPGDETALLEAGFSQDRDAETQKGETVYEHPRATLPRVLIRPGKKQNPSTIALRPEFVADFMARHNLSGEPEGEPFSRYRRIVVAEENGTTLEAVERHGYRGFVPARPKPGELEAFIKARELWRTRRHLFGDDAEGFADANNILERVLKLAGRDIACQLFFEAEREYWEGRNRAGQIQKRRQDQLGLGWGNHDHHTFRCSREHFVDLNEFLLKLGFTKRERYYAGAEAGWGAQISEQATVGIVVFADVDLMPDETKIDFSVKKLPPAPRLGTVGLWVGLHGESFLESGMHHLEARFEFNLLRDQLKGQGVNTMKPFSDFEFLRQAFTEGERWPVRRERAERLLSGGLITREQFEQFTRDGAIGSHLENLQRHGGFKGFNQKSVSVVISATDPRKNHFQAAPVAA